jgi:hypothetical protein
VAVEWSSGSRYTLSGRNARSVNENSRRRNMPCVVVVYRVRKILCLLNGRVFSALVDVVGMCFESTGLDMGDYTIISS